MFEFDGGGFRYRHKYKNPKYIAYVYQLICTSTQCIYIGKALNMRPVSSFYDYTRIASHFRMLKSGKHYIQKMQFDWITTEGDIKATVIEEYDVLEKFNKLSETVEFLKAREKVAIRSAFDSGIDLYNTLIPTQDLQKFTLKSKAG